MAPIFPNHRTKAYCFRKRRPRTSVKTLEPFSLSQNPRPKFIFMAWTEGDPVKTVFIICKTKIKCVAGIPLFSRQMLFSHATCRQQRQKKLRCLLDNFGQIVPTSECCVNYCCFSHDFGQTYAGDNKQMNSQRQHFVVYKYAVYISFF